MKHLIYILLFIVCHQVSGQSYFAKIQRNGGGNNTYAYNSATRCTIYNGSTVLDSYEFSANTGQSNDPPSVVILNATSPITRVEIYYAIRYLEGGGGAVSSCDMTQTINVTNSNCFENTFFRCERIVLIRQRHSRLCSCSDLPK